MWDVNERFDAKLIDSLPSKGFNVRSTGGVARVENHGCAAEFRKTPDGGYQMTLLPAILMHNQFTRLWDAGYQKFLLADDGRKVPAMASQLVALRRFNEELRAALGIPTYYNEALGSTCHVSTYDRVKGRPGDVPDESVGARTSANTDSSESPQTFPALISSVHAGEAVSGEWSRVDRALPRPFRLPALYSRSRAR